MKKFLFIVCVVMGMAMTSCNENDELKVTYPKAGDAVDLGLSVKWADRNVGAGKPEDCGYYYAWGETEPKAMYSWNTCKWYDSAQEALTKYNSRSSSGIVVDSKTVLDPKDDVANVKWRDGWRMPTDAECTELLTKCTWMWTQQNGVYGYKVTGPNGNSIFLPAAGFHQDDRLDNVGSYGRYWSSTVYPDDNKYGCTLRFKSDEFYNSYRYRFYGQSVRPVHP